MSAVQMDGTNNFSELYSSLQSVRVATCWTYVHVSVYSSKEHTEGNELRSSYFKVNFLLKILLFEVSRNGIKKDSRRNKKNRRRKIHVVRMAKRLEIEAWIQRATPPPFVPLHRPRYADSPPRSSWGQTDGHKDESPRWWNKMKSKARKECVAADSVGWIFMNPASAMYVWICER